MADDDLTPGQKAARTRKRRAAGKKAALTRKRREAGRKAAATRKGKTAKCSVLGCLSDADYEVVFYDFYPSSGDVFYETHNRYPYICEAHMKQNERGAVTEFADKTVRAYRGHVQYPFTPSQGQGFVIYRPL